MPVDPEAAPRPTTPQSPSRSSRPALARFATFEGPAAQRLFMGAKGGGHAKIELSRHRPAESSKSISRQSAPLAEPSQSPAIRFYERRSRLQRREPRKRQLPTKPIAAGSRFFCASVQTLAYVTPWPSRVAPGDRRFIFSRPAFGHRQAAETSIGNYSDQPPTTLTLRMDAANAIDRRRGRLCDEFVDNHSRSLQRAARGGANSRRMVRTSFQLVE
jgi:hypothetical protein